MLQANLCARGFLLPRRLEFGYELRRRPTASRLTYLFRYDDCRLRDGRFHALPSLSPHGTVSLVKGDAGLMRRSGSCFPTALSLSLPSFLLFLPLSLFILRLVLRLVDRLLRAIPWNVFEDASDSDSIVVFLLTHCFMDGPTSEPLLRAH